MFYCSPKLMSKLKLRCIDGGTLSLFGRKQSPLVAVEGIDDMSRFSFSSAVAIFIGESAGLSTTLTPSLLSMVAILTNIKKFLADAIRASSTASEIAIVCRPMLLSTPLPFHGRPLPTAMLYHTHNNGCAGGHFVLMTTMAGHGWMVRQLLFSRSRTSRQN